jgi:hypothetical protein
MRIVARKAANGTLPRREQLAIEQQRAATLSKLFPEIERLRIQLVFNDPRAHSPPPSPQQHTLYSAAQAFFRFACPCADCDGDFDLTNAVTSLVADTSGRKSSKSVDGELACHGLRFRDHVGLQASCPMHLRFQLVSEPRAKT